MKQQPLARQKKILFILLYDSIVVNSIKYFYYTTTNRPKKKKKNNIRVHGNATTKKMTMTGKFDESQNRQKVDKEETLKEEFDENISTRPKNLFNFFLNCYKQHFVLFVYHKFLPQFHSNFLKNK